MAVCEKCGYELQEFEKECPRCKRMGHKAQLHPEGGPAPDAQGQPARAQPPASQGQLAASGAMAGAIYGAVALTAFMLTDRFIFGGSESQRMGLILAAVLFALVGAAIGAAVGAATVTARSVAAGIVAGAVIVAFMKGAGMSGTGYHAGWTFLAAAVGLLYGALIGWLVASSVMRSIKWDQVQKPGPR